MVIAVDIGGTSIRIARIDSGAPASPATIVTCPTPDDIGEIPNVIIPPIDELGPVKAIGIGCAGLVDVSNGVLEWMPHAAGRDAELGEILTTRFGVPVLMDNDANLATLAEARFGTGRGYRMVLMVTLGTGIGAGLVVDGDLERGRGALGEVGHMRLAAEPQCVCGLSGCWEALVSGRVLDALAVELIGPTADGAALVAAATAGDKAAVASLEAAGEWLGIGLGNLIATLDPDVVVVGGGAADAGDALLAPAARYLESLRGGFAVAGVPPLVRPEFGRAAGLVGAAIAAGSLPGIVAER